MAVARADMNQLVETPVNSRRIAVACTAVLPLAAVATEGADTGSVPLAAAWTLSGGLALAALAVPRTASGRPLPRGSSRPAR